MSQGEDDILFKDGLVTEGFNFITPPPAKEFDCDVRIKHRQPLQKAHATVLDNCDTQIVFQEKQRAIAEGQYAVVYDGEICLGGGVINHSFDL